MNTTLAFLGTPEIVMIVVAVLLIFGPKKIPQLARSLGKAKREFNEAKSAFNDAVDEEESKEEPKKIAPPAEEEIVTDEAPTAKEEAKEEAKSESK
ncbi:twin-arginine translocase TatA/TatE family subunit [Lentisphaera marina]|uniref:twin-arginine translocase TatA/TatE family subunit n=1 Tax=Lentisphaera marina TaxID=1111041 RepID=UPI002365910C|nr:twin-arginine translocase TatA/TatE family subunit [Lentisphaera marina]MDD7983408.1 twin-arginine translocase TatA/TatE family subunit [Lentisphaera marina]